MVLSFQAQELAREDVQEAQLPAVLIDVEVRHRAYERIPESSTRFWRISCCGGAGCSCHSSLIRAMGPPFLLEPAGPSTSIITSSRLNDSGRALFTGVRRIGILRTSPFGHSQKFAKWISSLDRAGVSFGMPRPLAQLNKVFTYPLPLARCAGSSVVQP